MYEIKERVRYSEVRENGKMELFIHTMWGCPLKKYWS